jgi:hypothetical protein
LARSARASQQALEVVATEIAATNLESLVVI